MTKTAADIRKEGGKCKKIATDFWECTDKDGKVWWCSDGGKACVEKPKILTKTIGGLLEKGAKCEPVTDDLTICLDQNGNVWACKKETGTCTVILTPTREQKCETGFIPAQNEREWKELMCSDSSGLIRNIDDWMAYVEARGRDGEQGHSLAELDELVIEQFTENLQFRANGLAGANYQILATRLTFSKFVSVWEQFGIGLNLFADYSDRECVSPGTCRNSITDICTSNC